MCLLGRRGRWWVRTRAHAHAAHAHAAQEVQGGAVGGIGSCEMVGGAGGIVRMLLWEGERAGEQVQEGEGRWEWGGG